MFAPNTINGGIMDMPSIHTKVVFPGNVYIIGDTGTGKTTLAKQLTTPNTITFTKYPEYTKGKIYAFENTDRETSSKTILQTVRQLHDVVVLVDDVQTLILPEDLTTIVHEAVVRRNKLIIISQKYIKELSKRFDTHVLFRLSHAPASLPPEVLDLKPFAFIILGKVLSSTFI